MEKDFYLASLPDVLTHIWGISGELPQSWGKEGQGKRNRETSVCIKTYEGQDFISLHIFNTFYEGLPSRLFLATL